jgi:hypothetical protein
MPPPLLLCRLASLPAEAHPLIARRLVRCDRMVACVTNTHIPRDAWRALDASLLLKPGRFPIGTYFTTERTFFLFLQTDCSPLNLSRIHEDTPIPHPH